MIYYSELLLFADYGKQLFNGTVVYQPSGYFELWQHSLKTAFINIYILTMDQITFYDVNFPQALKKELQYLESSVASRP